MDPSKFDIFTQKKIKKTTRADIMSLLDGFHSIWDDTPDHEIVEIGSLTVITAPNVTSFGESDPTQVDESFIMRWNRPYAMIKYFEITRDVRMLDYAKMEMSVLSRATKILDLNIDCIDPCGSLNMGSRFKVRRAEVVYRASHGIVVRCWSKRLDKGLM